MYLGFSLVLVSLLQFGKFFWLVLVFDAWSPSQHFCFLNVLWGFVHFRDRFLISILCLTLVLYLSMIHKSICRILVIFFVDFAFSI